MKSLQAKIVSMLAIMLLISLVLAGSLIMDSMGDRRVATEYELKDEIAGHMNAAAGWQAIERGVGATILGSDNPSQGLINKFRSLGEKGDEEVRQGMEHIAELLDLMDDPDLNSAMSNSKQAYAGLKSARERVPTKSIKKSDWIAAASANIINEFLVRDITFAPRTPREKVLAYNLAIRSNVATLAEFAGRERAQLGGIIASGNPIPPNVLETLKSYRAIVENASNSVLAIKGLSSTPQKLSAAITAYESKFLGSYQQLREKVYNTSNQKAKGESADYPVSGGEWISSATEAINSALAISNTVGELSEGAVAQIQSDARNSIILNISLFVIAVGVFIFVYFFIHRSVVRPINAIIGSLSEGSKQISSASGGISTSSQALAEGATEQAASLEQTSASLEQMTSQTKQNADNANEASSLATTTRGDAEDGSGAMAEMVATMDEINKSSEEISKIIKVIEEIAFQTNLLALNAAVEAARAGEHGKGFAVVAEEVRNLAQRSATAAKDTAELIENAVSNAANGGKMATTVATMLEGIVGNVKKVTDLVGEIAAASNEQAQGVDQISTAVTQMDKVTQQNAANAEESAASSEEMNAQAESLNDVVTDLNRLISGLDSSSTNGRRNGMSQHHAALPAHKANRQKPQAARRNVTREPLKEEIIPMDDDFADF